MHLSSAPQTGRLTDLVIYEQPSDAVATTHAFSEVNRLCRASSAREAVKTRGLPRLRELSPYEWWGHTATTAMRWSS
jgi:hypothetical protein